MKRMSGPRNMTGELADVFAIQSEIAKAIADQLQAKLSPNEKKAIEQPPTTDLAAFDLYSGQSHFSTRQVSARRLEATPAKGDRTSPSKSGEARSLIFRRLLPARLYA